MRMTVSSPERAEQLRCRGCERHGRAAPYCYALSGLLESRDPRSQGVALGWFVVAPAGRRWTSRSRRNYFEKSVFRLTEMDQTSPRGRENAECGVRNVE